MDKLGLFKYADELRSARDQVLRESSNTGWAVFTYEGQTNVLKVAESGEDLEEGFQALDANKIMYMYARVIDPNSQLAKYVLVNWCGTGAPEMRKAVCATHVPEICRFLTKIHVTMNARSEDELSIENLQSRVAKASGANYNAGAAVQTVKPSTAPRPSNATGYVRPNAAAEIQASNREKFWEAHDKEDETARKNQEARRKAETQARFAPVKAAKPPVSAASTASSNGGASQAASASAKPTASLLSERDRFWAEQEAEEQRRREEEKRRIEEERQRREAETREREMKAAAKREAEAKARAEQIVTRKQYTAAAETSAPRTQAPSTANDAANDENERGKRPDAAKQARQQEIQALIKARNAQGDEPDSSLSKRADQMRAQRQEEIRKMMAQRGGTDDEEEERRRRAEELRKQREREMQEAFSKRSDTADVEEDERRRRADELRRNRQEEMRQIIGASGSAQPSVIATRNPPVVQPQSAPFRPNPPVIPSPVAAPVAPEPDVHAEASSARPYIPPMAKQVLPGTGLGAFRSAAPAAESHQPEKYAPAPEPALAPTPAPAPAPVAPAPTGINPVAAAAAAMAPNYTAQGGANINDSPNSASQKYFYKAGSSGQPSPSSSPTKGSRASSFGTNQPAPHYADPTNDESEPQDVYQNVPYVSPTSTSAARAPAATAPAAPAPAPPQDSNFYVNEQVNRGGPRESMNRVSDLYEPVSFGTTQSAKRTSYRNANDEDDEPDAPRPTKEASNNHTVRALYDYEAQDNDEISFSVDELITEVQQIDSGWWLGTNQSGKTGMFPANYVATFSDS